eukprot:2711608-Prymnesium_polylepis.1
MQDVRSAIDDAGLRGSWLGHSSSASSAPSYDLSWINELFAEAEEFRPSEDVMREAAAEVAAAMGAEGLLEQVGCAPSHLATSS